MSAQAEKLQMEPEYLKRYGINPDLFRPVISKSIISTTTTTSTSVNIKRHHSNDSFENVEPLPVQAKIPSPDLSNKSVEADTSFTTQSPKKKPALDRLRNCLLRKGKFKNAGLTKGSLTAYHSRVAKDCQYARRLIQLFENELLSKSQATEFVHGGKKYLAIACLSTVRIFEFTRGEYSEAKRIPDRYMKLSSNIITCIHFDDNKLYIAYLWGNTTDNVSKDDVRKPYIEVRDLNGDLKEAPIYTDYPIKSMQSDQDFTYYITTADTIHAHPKTMFYPSRYNLNPIISANDPVISYIVRPVVDTLNTTMLTVATTKREILIGRVTNLPRDTKDIRVFRFDDKFRDRSEITGSHYMPEMNKLIIIRRVEQSMTKENDENNEEDWHPTSTSISKRGPVQSLISIGSIQRLSSEVEYFVHELTLTFHHNIIQTRVNNKKLYVHGQMDDLSKETEIICIDLNACQLDWVTYAHIANNMMSEPHFNLFCHDNQVVKVRNYNEIEHFYVTRSNACDECSLTFATKEDLDHHLDKDLHPPCQLKFEILVNRSLSDTFCEF